MTTTNSLPSHIPGRYAADEVTYRPSAKGGFDIVHPDGTDWALTESSAQYAVKILTEGIRREGHTAREWRRIVTGK